MTKNPFAEIATIALELNEDELEVLWQVARGLLRGREVYGPLDVDNDIRDPRQEALEEVRDGLVYTGVALVQLMRRRGGD